MMLPPEDTDAIISLEGWRRKNRPPETCRHLRVWLDRDRGTVECRDCETTVSAFYVLSTMANNESQLFRRLEAMRQEIRDLTAWKPWMKIIRKLERLWRGGKYLPCCPHCRQTIRYQELEYCATRNVRFAKRPLRIATVVHDEKETVLLEENL